MRLVNAREDCYFKAHNMYSLLVTVASESVIWKAIEHLLDELSPKASRLIHCGVIFDVNAIALAPRSRSGKLEIYLKPRKETLAISEPFGHRFKQASRRPIPCVVRATLRQQGRRRLHRIGRWARPRVWRGTR